MGEASFGARLRALIERDGRSQRRFAQDIDIDPTQLNRIIKGKTARPDPETLVKIAGGLGVPYDEIAVQAGYPRAERSNGNGTLPPSPPPAFARDSDRLTVAEMVADIEARRGEAFRAHLAEAKARLPRENYVSFCVDLWRMFEGNSMMAFDLLRVHRDNPPDGI